MNKLLGLYQQSFWKRAFLYFLIIDALFIVLQVIGYVQKCTVCLDPYLLFISSWVPDIIITAFLWEALNRFFKAKGLARVFSNLLIFLLYMILIMIIKFNLQPWSTPFLIGLKTKFSFWQNLFYSSWFDIGKFVAKASCFYVLKFYSDFKKSQEQRVELAMINKDLQLNLLKQQLSPHFYFNTLNNLYGLARTNNFKLQEALYQLSNIMQYVIVDCNQSKVLLSQEVGFLQSYIALEKLRYEQNTVIEMNVNGHANGQTILPLLLIQFVENAFKHGMKEKSEHNWMRVKLDIEGDELKFSVDNSFYAKGFSGGIGVNSVKHRLNLLYDGKYEMEMNQQEDRFSVTLKLNLS